jgi:tripartite-type tricarboxylate transporter receptor subunit TctC
MLLDKTTTPAQREALALILAPQTVARPFAMPPGTPADRIAAMRQAFMVTMTDPEFVKEARTAGLDIAPMKGEDIAALYRKVYAAAPAVIAQARKAVGN